MAVTKLWKVSVRLDQVLDYTTNPEKTANPEYSAEDYQALKDVLAYAKDEEKTEHEFFCDGINCNVAMARDQFITVKEQFDKTDGIQAYHGYLSFKENEVTPEQAQQIGMEFARKMWGKRFQVVVTTHLNTKHLHCHFVINSVSFVDGKRLKDKEKSWYYFRHIADEICLEHKLSIVEKPELHRSPSYLTMKDEAGMPTRYNNAKKAIDEAIAMSRNLRQFQYELGVMGYHSNFSPNRKYATVT
ncbi:MAG: relaxase/mobilization nuclease domain-containing protein, partial [Ruminococcus sp.]